MSFAFSNSEQLRFDELVGQRVTKKEVQKWLLGALIWQVERCLTITLGDRLEADATPRLFAPELTQAVLPDKAGQIYKEPVATLMRELVLIAKENRPALIDEVNRRQQAAYDAIAIMIPFRLSAMLIGTLSNGFIATMSRPAVPELVELVERGFLPSLKEALLPTRQRGDTRSSDPWEGRIDEFKVTVDDWYKLIDYMRKFSIKYKRKPWMQWIRSDGSYTTYSENRDQQWLEKAMALISERVKQQSEANKSGNKAMQRKCRLALGALGLTCDLATRMMSPPIVKPNGDSYDTETVIK